MNSIKPPWTAEQVAALNHHQHAGEFHPYTCQNRSDEAHRRYASENGHGDHGILLATTDGWVCPVCNYRQGWAWEPPRTTSRQLSCPIHLRKKEHRHVAIAAALPGMVAWGHTVDEAVEYISAAIAAVLALYGDEGIPVPWCQEQPLNPDWERRIILVEVPHA